MQAMRIRVGAVLWMLCVQFFVAEHIAARGWRVPYHFAWNYVSDLGAATCDADVCSPLHVLMNASFVLQGLLIFGGALLVRRFFAPWTGYSFGLKLMAVCGVGVLVVGLAPEDLYEHLHVAGAVMHFIGGGAGMAAIGWMMVRDAKRSMIVGWVSLGLGVLVLMATVLLGFRGTELWTEMRIPVGLVERVPAYIIPAWVAGMGLIVGWRGVSPSTE